MDWGTGAALIVMLLAIIANHQLTLHRERRNDFNEIAAPIREFVARDCSKPNIMTGVRDYDFDRLITVQHWWRRRACREAVERYQRSKRDSIAADPQYGSAYCADPESVKAAAETLLPFTDPR